MTTQQGFPQISSPLVDLRTGIVSQTWLQLLISLWNRTGGQQGDVQAFSTGDLKPAAYSAIPAGWLPCDGSAVSRASYANLFAAIGTTWVAGDGANTFNVPDFRGRGLIGVSPGHPFASRGGAEQATLTVGNLPAHSHAVTDPGHAHSVTDPGHAHTGAAVDANVADSGSSANGSTSGNTGSSTTGVSVVVSE